MLVPTRSEAMIAFRVLINGKLYHSSGRRKRRQDTIISHRILISHWAIG